MNWIMRSIFCMMVSGITCSAAEWIYWTDRSSAPPRIQRSALDGSGVETIVTTGLSDPRGIAIDPFGEKIYWADQDTLLIQRADLNGSNIENIITSGVLDPRGIALDLEANKLYWTDHDAGKIQRSDLDGSGMEDVVTGLVNPYYVAVSPFGRKVYWTDPGSGKLQRANLDGTMVEDLVTAAVGNTLRGIAIDPTHTKIYWADRGVDLIQRANVNGSGVETLVGADLDRPHGVAMDALRQKVYWTDTGTGKIQQSDLNGSNVTDVVSSGITGPWGIALLLDDSDADGLPDAWEMQYLNSLTVSSGGPLDDWDQDGFIDSDEYVAGTDPTNPLSFFQASIRRSFTNDDLTVSWTSVSGRLYSVYTSTNLFDGITNSTGFVDVQSDRYIGTVLGTKRRFYNIEVKLAP
jgi:hypothetical protein